MACPPGTTPPQRRSLPSPFGAIAFAFAFAIAIGIDAETALRARNNAEVALRCRKNAETALRARNDAEAALRSPKNDLSDTAVPPRSFLHRLVDAEGTGEDDAVVGHDEGDE